MKDIILWQSAASRERERRHLSELAALHKSATPPSELLLPAPRKLRWKRNLKYIVGFQLLLIVFAICMTTWVCIFQTRFYNDTMRDLRRGNERMRHYATQTVDSEKKAKAEKSIRESEKFERKWRALNIGMLTILLVGTLGNPVTYVAGTWFHHIRPELIVLRSGVPVRATVIGGKRCLLATRLKMEFTTESGTLICKKQFLRGKEASLLGIGSLVWMLYLPRRPKCARIYGLKSALAEVVR